MVISGLDLEVGPGTFKPVEVEDPREHPMHPERYEITARLAALIEMVVNLSTVKALGLKLPQSFLLRADELIQ